MSSQGPFVPVKIDLAIQYSHLFHYEFHIMKPNGEFVLITSQAKGLKHMFEGYKGRGLKEIYISDEAYAQLTEQLREMLSKKKNAKDAFKDINLMYDNVKMQLQKIGLRPIAIKAAQEVNKATITRLSQIPTLIDLIANYKDSCSDHFFRYLMTSFITSQMIDTFPWKSEQIKIKVGMAAMSCDISLALDDYKEMTKSEESKDWPQHILNHPIITAQKLQEADPTLPSEVIQMIEMHHENPDGTGFPRGVHYNAIPLLPSILIVGGKLIEELDRVNMEVKYLDDILTTIYHEYNKGIFRQSSMGLFRCLGRAEPT